MGNPAFVVCLAIAAAVSTPASAQTYQDGTWRDKERLTKVTGIDVARRGQNRRDGYRSVVKQQYIIETADLMVVATLVRS